MTVPLILPQFRRWADEAEKLGFTDFLSAEDGFRTCLKTSRSWRNGNECGVYFWIAEDGETYVGETVKARSRLMQHLRNHPDLRYACFQKVPREHRKAREFDLIECVEEIFPTRNIKGAIRSEAHVPFDDFVSLDERNVHLQGDWLEDEGEWRELPLLTQKQARRYARFRNLPDRDRMLTALFLFIWSVLPLPRITEGRFWSVSLFVGPHILRVNAGQQEIFTVSRAEDGHLYARLLALQAFRGDAQGPLYQTKSYDHWMHLDELADWLEEDKRLASARELAVRLMRHTTTLNSGSHCPQIVRAADELARSLETLPEPSVK